MNNSWAMNGATYCADDRTVDLGVRDADATATDQTPLVIVFSAGNSGSGAGTVTKNPKNAILVGNSLNCASGRDDGERRHPRPRNGVVARACGRRAHAPDGRRTRAPTSSRPTVPSGFRSGPYTDTGGTLHAVHAPMSGTSMASPHVAGQRSAAHRLVASDAQRQDAEPRARQGPSRLEHRVGRGRHRRGRRHDRRRAEQQRRLGPRLARERAAAGARLRPRAEDLRRPASGVHGDGSGVHDPGGRSRRRRVRCASRCRGRMPRAPWARTRRSSTTSISRCGRSAPVSSSAATSSRAPSRRRAGSADDLNNTEVVVDPEPDAASTR